MCERVCLFHIAYAYLAFTCDLISVFTSYCVLLFTLFFVFGFGKLIFNVIHTVSHAEQKQTQSIKLNEQYDDRFGILLSILFLFWLLKRFMSLNQIKIQSNAYSRRQCTCHIDTNYIFNGYKYNIWSNLNWRQHKTLIDIIHASVSVKMNDTHQIQSINLFEFVVILVSSILSHIWRNRLGKHQPIERWQN